MAEVLTGHCLCGAVTIRAEMHPDGIGACHCRMCQRWSGSVFASFPGERVAVEGPVTRYGSSEFSERAFCTVCGSHLWMRDYDDPEGHYDLMPGLFDEAASWPLRREIYVDQAMTSMTLTVAERRATAAEYEQKNAHVQGAEP